MIELRRRYNGEVYYNLPPKYQQVKYIQGGWSETWDNLAYLLITEPIDSSCGLQVTYSLSSSTYGSIFCSQTYGLGGMRIGGTYGNSQRGYCYTNFNILFTFDTLSEALAYKVVNHNFLNDGILSVNTEGYEIREFTIPVSLPSDSGFYLFVNPQINATHPYLFSQFINQIHDFKLSRGTDVVLHLVPCYRKSDNKPGMYDLINDVFYTNAGTGEFIVGPDVN